MAKHTIIQPDDLNWRESKLMRIPNADFLERTGSENLGARLWKFPPSSAGTLHKHISTEEFYFVLEGTGRIRVDDETITIAKKGGIHVMPEQLRQVFNDTEFETLWLIIGGPENEIPKGEKPDLKKYYPSDPTALPAELSGKTWPPKKSMDHPLNPS